MCIIYYLLQIQTLARGVLARKKLAQELALKKETQLPQVGEHTTEPDEQPAEQAGTVNEPAANMQVEAEAEMKNESLSNQPAEGE